MNFYALLRPITFFCVSAALLFASTSSAQEHTKWRSYLEDIKSKASSGEADAQGILSVFIQTDFTTGTDDDAYSLAKKSTTASSAFGLYALGRCHEKAVGTTKDVAKAQSLYKKAIPILNESAEAGNDIAQKFLGDCYDTGRGVSKNRTEAVKWYRKAADQGLAASQYELGVGYAVGEGVPKDKTEAVKWYRKAADQGLAEAQFNLGGCYVFGEGVPKDYSEAVKWFRRAADQGHAAAQYALGLGYAVGEGVPKDKTEAVKWYRKAADQGLAEAIEALKKIAPQDSNSGESIVQRSQNIADGITEDQTKKVSDPDAEKNGGPPTITVMKLMNGSTSNSAENSAQIMMMGIISKFGVQVKEIKRGEPLTSLISANIPSGTTVFPVRIILQGMDGSTTRQDMYFYKDEFGEWASVIK
jgi:TPR repeat protein